jgi:hypothetical protein
MISLARCGGEGRSQAIAFDLTIVPVWRVMAILWPAGE